MQIRDYACALLAYYTNEETSKNSTKKVEMGLKLRPVTHMFMPMMQGKLQMTNVSYYFRHW